jgi:predicted DNA-binding transcriptional regulator AlpA
MNSPEIEDSNKLTDKRLLSVQESANYLGLSARTLYNGIAPKSKAPFPVKPKRYGKRVLFDIRDLDQFCDSLGAKDEKLI